MEAPPDPNESRDVDVYDRWLAGYTVRRQEFHREIITVSEELCQAAFRDMGDSLSLPALTAYARQRRPTLTHKFCMLLWSRRFDESLFKEFAKGEDLGPSDEDAARFMRSKEENFRPRIARLTVRLDLAGYFALMLYPEGKEGAPPEPLVLEAPAPPPELQSPWPVDMWFFLLTGFIELAQAIVIEANYGRGLAQEMQHIARRGLADRVLRFDVHDELYTFDESRHWALERIGEAVAYAAARAAG